MSYSSYATYYADLERVRADQGARTGSGREAAREAVTQEECMTPVVAVHNDVDTAFMAQGEH